MDNIRLNYGQEFMSLEEKARLRVLPEKLSLWEIAELLERDPEKRESLAKTFADAIMKWELPMPLLPDKEEEIKRFIGKKGKECRVILNERGDRDFDEYRKRLELPLDWSDSETIEHVMNNELCGEVDFYRGLGQPILNSKDEDEDVLLLYARYIVVHRIQFRKFLMAKGDWPLPQECLLANWWKEPEERESKSAKNIMNSVRAERKCKDWLKKMMKAGEKEHAKKWYMAEAMELFPGLAERQFDRAWKTAIKETNSHAWSKAGRRKKS